MMEETEGIEERDVAQLEEEEDDQPIKHEVTTESNIYSTDVSDEETREDIISTSETTPISPGEGTSWAILEIIKNVIQIAFSN